MKIAVDFDGTLVEHKYPKIGKEIPFAFETLRKLQKDNHQLILWSVREGDLLDEAVNYCKSKGIEFYAINSDYPDEYLADSPDITKGRKLKVDIFIDDRNLGGLLDWGIVYQMITEGWSFDNYYEYLHSETNNKRNKGIFEKLFTRR